MKHVSLGMAADFVRGLLGEPERTLVRHHLESCEECRAEAAFLQKVLAAAVTIDVPPDLVEQATRIFDARTHPRAARRTRRSLAELVFADFGGMQLAEVRSSRSTERQALFRCETYWISVRAEREPDRADVAIIGQISNEQSPDVPLQNVTVRVLERDRVLGGTLSNSLGEFSLEFTPGRSVRLELELESTTIEVPLTRLVK